MRSSPITSRTVSPALAFAIAALGIGLFSMMDAVMKSLVLAIGVYNALLWRQMISVGLGAVAWKLGKSGQPSARALKLHLARVLVTTAMAVLFFWGLARVPMAQAIALSYIAPLLALLLGAAFLDERVGRRADRPDALDPVATAALAAGSDVLTDDFAPVDQLLNPYTPTTATG